MFQLSDLLFDQICAAVQKAGALFSHRELAAQSRRKGPTDFVTAVDTAVQDQLKCRLAALAPEIQFMGEEQDNSGVDLSGQVWILDPVDGTTNLLHDLRHSAVSLALAEEGRVLLGIVYDPYSGELFTARRGQGAFCCGQPIHVSSASSLGECLCSTGTNPSCRELADRTFRRMRLLYDRCHDIRRIGAASLELSYLAAGRLDCYVEHGLKPWDYAAGMLLVREAGGVVTTPEGGEPSLSHGSEIAAAAAPVHPQLLAALREADRLTG